MATIADQPDIEVVGEVQNETELADIVEQVRPDVLIIAMDLVGSWFPRREGLVPFRKWSSAEPGCFGLIGSAASVLPLRGRGQQIDKHLVKLLKVQIILHFDGLQFDLGFIAVSPAQGIAIAGAAIQVDI